MQVLSLGRILAGLAMILFIGAVTASATGAFFSDTETSTGNTFTAGDIDLKIDNESYVVDYNIPGWGSPTGAFLLSTSTSWSLADLIEGTHKFFNFTDLKPGDVGEDTISIHVGSNDAWMCASARITSDLDNSFTEPEDAVSGANNDGNDGTIDGDLDSGLQFAFWKDDGDNVLEVGEVPFLSGTLANMGAAGAITLVDSLGGPMGPSPIPGDTDVYIGKAWCYGTLAAGTTAQDGLGKVGTPANPNNTPNGPTVRGTGVTCDGSGVGNIGQTDSVEGDMQFFAVQSRNNANFTCASGYTPLTPPVSQDN